MDILNEQILRTKELMGVISEQEQESPFIKLKGQHFEYCHPSSILAVAQAGSRKLASTVILEAAGLPTTYSGDIPMEELYPDSDYVKSLTGREKRELTKKIKQGASPHKDEDGMYTYCRYWIIPDYIK